MAGEFEIDYNGAKVYLKNNGKLKYEGSEEGQEKLKKALEPIFDYIKCYSNQSYLGNERRIDTYMEKELFKKLKSVFETYANDDIEGNELELGDEFIKNDGYTNVAQFLNTKGNEIKQEQIRRTQAEQEAKKAEAEAQAQREAEEARLEEEAKAEEEARQAAEFSAQLAAKAQAIEEKKAHDKKVFDASIMKMAREVDTDAISGGETYTIKKGDSFWNIAKQSLKDEGIDKPNNKAIMKRMAEICALNNINMSTLKLKVGNTLTLPGAGGAGGAGGSGSKSGTSTPTVSVATQEDFENKTDDGSWEIVNDAKVYQDGSGNIQIVQKGGTVPSGYTEVDVNNTLCRDVASGNYYYVPQTPPPSGGASGSSSKSGASTPTVSEATQSELNASDWDAESSATVWKDDGGNVIVVLSGDGTDLDDLESINATVWKDNDGNYHYVMNE